MSDPGAGVQNSPAVAGDLVLYGDDDGRMRALHLADGSLEWEIDGTGRIVAAPVANEDTVVFGVIGPSALRPPKLDYLVAVNLTSGERIWALNDSYSVPGAPLIGGDRVFFATVEGYLSKTVMRSASLNDGELLWERTMPGVIDSSAALLTNAGADDPLSDARVLFGCHDGRLYLLDAMTGKIVDVTPIAKKIYSSPAVAGGRVFVGAGDGHLHCLVPPQ
jgi:outer membrane protein assembly factor BamB